jgi:Tol biopolymer transport system component
VATVDLYHPLLRHAGDPDWSASGRQIAGGRYEPINGHSGMGYQTLGVFRARANGTHRFSLSDHGLAPSWSPNGTRIAFAGDLHGLRTVETSGGGYHLLDSHRVLDVDWSVHNKIAYTRGFYSVYTIDPDGQNRHFVVHGLEPDWSPGGGKIVFRESSGSIAVMNANGSGLHVIRSATDGFSPVWSPDGTKVAFTVNSSDVNGDVYVMNANGTGERRVAQLPPDACGGESLVTQLDWQSTPH